ncbi:hypothetical protein [Algoriphagus hitonicola]|uniref:Outer membrane protein beta-barrel domain-containing protein n=1 Tax=Algoriphagus hitonicola TaxID=435880 RepID=A0A1I2U1F2_9BACT|nr:hypothetical protein [Algoriphagus hitonicola]SFG68716.1 hypothetical protein SAMN04487988_106226 [Algoriphagus hitonicola]
MKNFILISVLFIGLSNLQAQTTEPREQGKAFYLELFGNGITYSLNYDQRFQKRMDGLGFKAGASFLSLGGSSVGTVPVGLNYLLGKEGKFFEMGMGSTLIFGGGNTDFAVGDGEPLDTYFLGTMTFGYRSEPTDGGFLFRANLTPIFGGFGFYPFFGGISVGYAF